MRIKMKINLLNQQEPGNIIQNREILKLNCKVVKIKNSKINLKTPAKQHKLLSTI